MSSLLPVVGAGCKYSAFVTGSRSFPPVSCCWKTKPTAWGSAPAQGGGSGAAARGREVRPGPGARRAALGAGAAAGSAEHGALRARTGQAGAGLVGPGADGSFCSSLASSDERNPWTRRESR